MQSTHSVDLSASTVIPTLNINDAVAVEQEALLARDALNTETSTPINLLPIPEGAQLTVTNAEDEAANDLNSDEHSSHSTEEMDGDLYPSNVDSDERMKRTSKQNAIKYNDFREHEWKSFWTDSSTISFEVSHTHLQKASYTIKEPQLLAHLKELAFMIKYFHKDSKERKEKVAAIQTTIDFELLTQNMDLSKILKPITERQERLEIHVASMSTQLNEVQTTMKWLVSTPPW